ncbi:hypothetical protein GEV33_010374 [Tenebrio molitor]|uniref:Uncharacterized protein n=1 Tax=Tenebrio molitor TaxID=7067 RepID=A0A8J6LAT6_TENMO|nr:hypothetical protein GEV33_010374 [Tenebrio molitor]
MKIFRRSYMSTFFSYWIGIVDPPQSIIADALKNRIGKRLFSGFHEIRSAGKRVNYAPGAPEFTVILVQFLSSFSFEFVERRRVKRCARGDNQRLVADFVAAIHPQRHHRGIHPLNLTVHRNRNSKFSQTHAGRAPMFSLDNCHFQLDRFEVLKDNGCKKWQTVGSVLPYGAARWVVDYCAVWVTAAGRKAAMWRLHKDRSLAEVCFAAATLLDSDQFQPLPVVQHIFPPSAFPESPNWSFSPSKFGLLAAAAAAIGRSPVTDLCQCHN